MAPTKKTRTDSGTNSGTGRRTGGRAERTHRRALRREAPSTVAILADERDFTAMCRYPSFAFDDHSHYLQQMEALMRALSSQGIHVTVTLFAPEEYAEYCTETRQNPDSSDARTHYTAEVAAGGPTVPYRGQPLEHLIVRLTHEADRQATWDYATDVLARTGDCADCGQDLARTAFDRASHAVMRLLESVGAGVHHLVCSVPVEEVTLIGVLHAEYAEGGQVRLAEGEALVLCTVLAAGIATDGPAGVVLRTGTGRGHDEVRGWSLRDGWLRPLTEAEVFNAYCTDAESGEPVPPEPGVVYRPGTEIPPPSD